MDVSQRNGNYPPPAGASEILGVEFSGHVVAVGAGVDKWKEGDEVLGLAGGVSVLSTFIDGSVICYFGPV